MSDKMNRNKKSHKTKKPISIRLNKVHLEAAMFVSGRETVQELVDYLLHKYVAENGKCLVAPIDFMDKRPIDESMLKLREADKKISSDILGSIVPPKVNNTDLSKILNIGNPLSKEEEEIESMPMWKPKKNIT